MLENIRFFVDMLGWWFVLSRIFIGFFGKVLWWILRLPAQDHKKVLEKYLLGLIQNWYVSEKENPLDPKGGGMILICGFFIYAYAFKEHRDELTQSCVETIRLKRNWISI